MHCNIHDLSTGHLNVANVSEIDQSKVATKTSIGDKLIEEWLKYDDFVSLLKKAHKGAQHTCNTVLVVISLRKFHKRATFICASGYGNFFIRINFMAKEGRICGCDRFP
jgi:hypothetical protein